MPQSPPPLVSPSQLAVTHLAPPGVHNRRLVCEEGQEFSARLRPSPLSVQWALTRFIIVCCWHPGQVQAQCSAGERERCVLLNSHWLDATNWQGLVFTLLFPAIASFLPSFLTDIHTPPSVQCVLVIHPLFPEYEHSHGAAERSIGN